MYDGGVAVCVLVVIYPAGDVVYGGVAFVDFFCFLGSLLGFFGVVLVFVVYGFGDVFVYGVEVGCVACEARDVADGAGHFGFDAARCVFLVDDLIGGVVEASDFAGLLGC